MRAQCYTSFFLYKSNYFNSFVPIFAFINDKKVSNIDLVGNVWFGQDAIISSKNTRSIELARNSLSFAEGGIYHFHTHILVLTC